MAKVLLVSTATTPRHFLDDDYARVKRSAAKDVFKAHTTTDDPAAADLIIFFEGEDPWLARDVRRHPFVKGYPEKVFLVDPSDRVLPYLPGIYASIDRAGYNHTRVRSGFFPFVYDYDWITYDADSPAPTLLFSFVGGAQGQRVREAIMALDHPRALIRDTSDYPENEGGLPDASYERYRRDFAAVLRDSKFVLCPAGAGSATPRFFETMKAGRVPVILSDRWVPPEGPRWQAFSLRVPERDVTDVPQLLEAHEPRAAEMGRLARAEWEQWFSEPVCFHRIVEWCLSIQRARRVPERLMMRLVLWQLLMPFHFRRKLVPAVWKSIRAPWQ
jgi:hypothetical protein